MTPTLATLGWTLMVTTFSGDHIVRQATPHLSEAECRTKALAIVRKYDENPGKHVAMVLCRPPEELVQAESLGDGN